VTDSHDAHARPGIGGAPPAPGLQQTAALSAVGRLLVESLDLEVVAERIVEGLRLLLQAPAGSLYRLDPASGDLVAVAATANLGPSAARPLRLPSGTGLAGLAVREGRPVASANVLTDPRLTHTAETEARIERAAYRSALSVPLIVKGKVIGTLSVGDRAGRAFEPAEVELARAFADHAALALENARLYEEAEQGRREAERIAEALRQSNEMLEALVHCSALGIVGLDREARVTVWNSAAERIFGWSAAEAIGRFLPLIADDSREEFLANFGVALRGGVFSGEVRRRRKDGSPVDLRVSTAPLRDAAGRITGVVTVVEDVTEQRRAAEALQASEARYRAIVESQTELVCRYRADGTVTFANDAFCRYFGRVREELVGQVFVPTIHPADLPEVRERLASLGPGERVVTVENRIIGPGGAVRWTQWTNVALYDDQGRFIEFQAVGRDVTDERRAAARQRLLAEASRVLAASLDYEATLADLARLAVPDLADWCTVDMVEPDDSLRRVAAAPLDPGPPALAGRLGRGDAATLTVAMVARGRPIGTLTLGVGVARGFDAGDRALAEELAARAALAVENARLYRETEAANRAKDQFLATLAHELRNPLAPILNALQALYRLGPASGEGNQLRDIIARQTRHLARLVDDLLDLSRVASGKVALERQAIDLRDVAARSLRALQASGRARLHEVLLDAHAEPVVVEGDPVRLEQVLGNLLDNAVKYSPEGGPVRLTVRDEGGQGVVSVEDRGIGIAPEMLEAIFQAFTQVDTSLDRPRGGLGLGLAVARGLVEQHGGRISAHSAGLGRGSEFVLQLPLAAAAPAAPPEPASPGRTAVRHIVVVEDYPDAREALRTLLTLDGHAVATAADGREGVELIRQLRPDVGLVDIGLPGLDGYEVAREVRAAPGGTGVYLIALTGYGQAYDRRRALEAGFDLHLVKPVDVGELSQALARLDRPGAGRQTG
jgi:PAS domain S-box-containing protein